MKRSSTTNKLPPELTTPEGRAVVLAKAASPTESEEAVSARWSGAVAVNGGGFKAVREALAARRKRGPNKNGTKVLVSFRIKRETLERWKATGPGWQTRMSEALDKVL